MSLKASPGPCPTPFNVIDSGPVEGSLDRQQTLDRP